jgi:hypothetical protein
MIKNNLFIVILLLFTIIFLVEKNKATETKENTNNNKTKQWGGSCLTNPCYNGGICISTGFWNRYCICQKYFTGPSCTACMNVLLFKLIAKIYIIIIIYNYIDSNLCLYEPCKNGGTCDVPPMMATFTFNYWYTCQCSIGFTGKNCENSNLNKIFIFL